MDRFFDANNPVMRALSRLVDLAVLNIVTLILTLPVITAGASMTAMNNVLMHLIRDDESYVSRMFVKSFKLNFRQALPEGLLVLLMAAVTAADLWILHSMDSRPATLLMIIITVIAGFLLAASVYMFALQSRYENTIGGTIANAFRLALGNLPRTLGMMIIWVLWILVLWWLHGLAPLAIALYGFTLPGYMCALLYEPVFTRLEEGEEE